LTAQGHPRRRFESAASLFPDGDDQTRAARYADARQVWL